jgi:hypothetical protein
MSDAGLHHDHGLRHDHALRHETATTKPRPRKRQALARLDVATSGGTTTLASGL